MTQYRSNPDQSVIVLTPKQEARFFSRVEHPDGPLGKWGCWTWTGSRLLGKALTYGQYHYTSQNQPKCGKAHRLMWELTNGPIPPGLMVLPKCDNPLCVRPDHLYLGTAGDNRDMLKRIRPHRRLAPERTEAVTAESFQVWENTRRGFGMSRFGEQVAGKAWNRWLALEYLGRSNPYAKVRIRVLCQCGTERIVNYDNLWTGRSKSCGCLAREVSRQRTIEYNIEQSRITVEGASMYDSPDYRLYKIWWGMLQRCYNALAHNYRLYGARGIRVCEAWWDFRVFRDWARANGYADHLSIDRYPNKTGHYEPGNCRWGTWTEQNRNKTTNRLVRAWGEVKILAEWIEDPRCQAKTTTVLYRLNSGWPPEVALETPPHLGAKRPA